MRIGDDNRTEEVSRCFAGHRVDIDTTDTANGCHFREVAIQCNNKDFVATGETRVDKRIALQEKHSRILVSNALDEYNRTGQSSRTHTLQLHANAYAHPKR